MKIYNKFVESKKEPYNKNDIWFDGSSWKMYKEGVWRSFTLPIELAKDIEDAVKDLDLSNYLKKTDIDSALSETSTNPVENKVITERLNNIKTATPDWNASEGKAGHINGRSHYIDGAISIPFEHWDKRFDEDGNAIYFHTIPPDNYFGCLIREGGWQEENYVFFGTEWKSLYPAVSADIRVNYDSEVGDSVLEIKLYQDADSESFLANFINNALFAYGQGEDFIYPIANEFIPNTIARQESVDELREETTALWENLDHGTFPDLTAGDLAGRGESVPASFGFRASGGKSIKDGRAYIKRIKGNSVVWNQKFERGAIRSDAGAQQYNDEATGEMVIDGTITTGTQYSGSRAYGGKYADLVVGHKYLTIIRKISGTYSGTTSYIYLGGSGHLKLYTGDTERIGFWEAKSDSIPYSIITFQVGDTFNNLRYIIRNHDLTQMFGAGNEPTTIEEFQSRVATLGIDMYAYNEGQVIHCNTESIKSVGDNAWDEEWELGAYSGANGDKQNVTNYFRSKNRIKILPNTDYYFACPSSYSAYARFCFYDEQGNFINYVGSSAYLNKTFKTPSNAYYMVFWTGDSMTTPTYNNDIMITLVHSGWKQDTDAGYQPYWQDTLPLPIISKYFPDGMRSAGTAKDEIRHNKASGKWEAVQMIGSVDMADLTLFYNASNEGYFYGALNGAAKHSSWAVEGNLLSASYTITNANAIAQSGATPTDKTLAIAPNGNLYIVNKAYTDVASFKASLEDTDVIYYVLAEPIVTEITDTFRDYYQVADFGTEMSQSNVPSAAFSADIIYQFNAVDMIREHEMEINELQSIIATMQAQLTSLINK